MKLLTAILDLIYPPTCVLCGNLLEKNETDLCHRCRIEAPTCSQVKKNIPHVASCAAVWYYEDMVRESLLRYKFRNARSYADVYGRFVAMKLAQQMEGQDFMLTWVPISAKRRRKRGYDQVELIAQAVSRELNIPAVQTLKKTRDNPPQSTISGEAQRRANVLGVYDPVKREQFYGKQLVLLDDIITTGATISEASRVLLTYGATKVHFVAVAAASAKQKNQ